MRVARLVLALLGGLALVPSAFAQGCALCYTTAASASAAAIRSLDIGIVVLLVPSLVMFVAVLAFAIRRASASAEASRT